MGTNLQDLCLSHRSWKVGMIYSYRPFYLVRNSFLINTDLHFWPFFKRLKEFYHEAFS
jgi:hypothetical protein